MKLYQVTMNVEVTHTIEAKSKTDAINKTLDLIDVDSAEVRYEDAEEV